MDAKEDVTLPWKNGKKMDGHVIIVASSLVYINYTKGWQEPAIFPIHVMNCY